MDKIKIIDSKKASAEKNMLVDRDFLNNLENSPILHLYDWDKDSATYGYFTDPMKYIDLDRAKKRGLDLARRPTGGGITFHIWDLAFSFLMPSSNPNFSNDPLVNYKFVNQVVLDAVSEYLSISGKMNLTVEDFKTSSENCSYFCMARPTKYDVIMNNKKIAGAAQRKTKKGYLHQGSISLKMADRDYLEDILLDKKVVEAIFENSLPVLDERKSLEGGRLEIKELLVKYFKIRLEIFP